MGKCRHAPACSVCLAKAATYIISNLKRMASLIQQLHRPSPTHLLNLLCTEQFPYSLGSDHTNCFLLFILFWHQTRSRRCPTQGRDARDLINSFPSFNSEIPRGTSARNCGVRRCLLPLQLQWTPVTLLFVSTVL